jgi:hypothetical protein
MKEWKRVFRLSLRTQPILSSVNEMCERNQDRSSALSGSSLTDELPTYASTSRRPHGCFSRPAAGNGPSPAVREAIDGRDRRRGRSRCARFHQQPIKRWRGPAGSYCSAAGQGRLGLSIRHVRRHISDRARESSASPPATGRRVDEEKVITPVHRRSPGIHATRPHLDRGKFAGTYCGDLLAPPRR